MIGPTLLFSIMDDTGSWRMTLTSHDEVAIYHSPPPASGLSMEAWTAIATMKPKLCGVDLWWTGENELGSWRVDRDRAIEVIRGLTRNKPDGVPQHPVWSSEHPVWKFKYESAEARCRELAKERDDALSKNDGFRHAIGTMTKRIDELMEQIAGHDKKIQEYADSRSALLIHLDAAERNTEELKREIADRDKRLVERNERLVERNRELNEICDLLSSDEYGDPPDIKAEIVKLQADYNRLLNTQSDLLSRAERAEKHAEVQERTATAALKSYTEEKRRSADLERKLQSANDGIAMEKARADQNERAVEWNAEAYDTNENLKAHISALQEEDANRTRRLSAATSALGDIAQALGVKAGPSPWIENTRDAILSAIGKLTRVEKTRPSTFHKFSYVSDQAAATELQAIPVIGLGGAAIGTATSEPIAEKKPDVQDGAATAAHARIGWLDSRMLALEERISRVSQDQYFASGLYMRVGKLEARLTAHEERGTSEPDAWRLGNLDERTGDLRQRMDQLDKWADEISSALGRTGTIEINFDKPRQADEVGTVVSVDPVGRVTNLEERVRDIEKNVKDEPTLSRITHLEETVATLVANLDALRVGDRVNKQGTLLSEFRERLNEFANTIANNRADMNRALAAQAATMETRHDELADRLTQAMTAGAERTAQLKLTREEVAELKAEVAAIEERISDAERRISDADEEGVPVEVVVGLAPLRERVLARDPRAVELMAEMLANAQRYWHDDRGAAWDALRILLEEWNRGD